MDDRLSKPTYEIEIERNVRIPMRDGTRLSAIIYKPKGDGPFPALVERVPYELEGRLGDNGEYYARRGYVVVGQNTRGSFASEGRFYPFKDDAWGANRDGYDTIEWTAAQSWSNGRVGTIGGSYSGATQYLLAPTRPPHLVAMFVREGPSDMYWDWAYHYGAFYLDILFWTIQCAPNQLNPEIPKEEAEKIKERLKRGLQEIQTWYSHLPLHPNPLLQGVADWYDDWLAHPTDGPYWWQWSFSLKHSEVDVPIFHLGGWYDVFKESTLRAFKGISARGRTEGCRRSQKLMMGPWSHGPGNVSATKVGAIDFGSEASRDLREIRLRWYDHWLKGIDTGMMDEPPAQIFVMGANRWRWANSWPPENTTYKNLYFREGTGRSEGSLNNGKLTFEPPGDTERPDSFLYDPMDPVPTLVLYPNGGPADHRPIEGKMLTYTTEPLENDLEVMGPMKCTLYGMSSTPDTDWVARICDVYPDGTSISLTDGILRARYRESFEKPQLLIPQKVYRFEIDLGATANLFKAGHRIRISITSSDFPRYDRNMNTGGPPGGEVEGRVAVNTVFHDSLRPSHVIFPISQPK
ncbi:MAG: CocE/NonD family hydrolase [bacterium]